LTLRWLSIGAVVLGSLAAALTRDRQVVPLAATGLAVIVLFDAPLALAVKAEQLHFIATGSVLLVTAGFTALYRASHRPSWRAVVAGAALVTLAASTLVARSIARDFAPCAPRTLATNAIVREWAAVPFEIRQGLPTRPDACMNQPGTRMTGLPLIAFGAQGWEQDGLDAFRWTGKHVVLLVSAAREQVLLRARLRNPHVSSTALRVRVGGAGWRCRLAVRGRDRGVDGPDRHKRHVEEARTRRNVASRVGHARYMGPRDGRPPFGGPPDAGRPTRRNTGHESAWIVVPVTQATSLPVCRRTRNGVSG